MAGRNGALNPTSAPAFRYLSIVPPPRPTQRFVHRYVVGTIVRGMVVSGYFQEVYQNVPFSEDSFSFSFYSHSLFAIEILERKKSV